MISTRLKTFVAAVAAMAAACFVGSRAEAAIEIVASVVNAKDGISSTSTDVFYSSSSIFAQSPVYSLGGYNFSFDTTTTDYAGINNVGSISTTINITSAPSPVGDMTVSVMIIGNVGAPLDPTAGTGPLTGANLLAVENSPILPWLSPAGSPVRVTSNTSTSSQASYSGTTGTGATTSYFDSPPTIGLPRTTETGGPTPGTPVVTSGALPLYASPSPNVSMSTQVGNPAGTYSLSQSITLDGIASVTPFNVTGTSTVTAVVPEPSSMGLSLAGGLLMLAGAWARRRRG